MCKSNSYESISLTIGLPSGHELLVIGVYHPPSKFQYREADLIDYISEISDNFLDRCPNGVVLCGGDLNHLDLNLLSIMSGLTVLDDFPTRGDSVLDNCLTNRTELFSSPSSIPALMRKDHYGVILPAGCKLKPVRSKVKFRDYRDHKKILFERKLQECDWSSVTDAQDVETASTFFYFAS